MEPKCGYCDLFGDKYHCNNCKLMQTKTANSKQIHLNDFTLEDIVALDESIFDELRIGDSCKIQLLSSEEINIIYMGSHIDTLSDGSGTAKASFITTIDGRFQMQPSSSNIYRLSSMRNTYLSRFFRLLPPILQENIKMVRKQVYDTEYKRIIDDNTNLWLLSEQEVFGRKVYSSGDEGEQYEYFTKKAKIKEICSGPWWLRSPMLGSAGGFCCVGSGGGPLCAWSEDFLSVVFGFCI